MTQERTDEDVVRDAIHCACTVAKWDEFEIEPLEWNVCEGHAALDRLAARNEELAQTLFLAAARNGKLREALEEIASYPHTRELGATWDIARTALAPEEPEGAEK